MARFGWFMRPHGGYPSLLWLVGDTQKLVTR